MRDELFIRGKVPMTKGEVRAVALSKLELDKTAIVYDIGAGTGSVAIEAAQAVSQGEIYAVEQKTEAVDLIWQNKIKFQVDNLHIISASAPQALLALPTPTHAFIGGSTGQLVKILQVLRNKNPKIRIVISAITLETLCQITTFLKQEQVVAEIIQIQISKAHQLGEYQLMKAENPVFLVCFGGVE